MLLKLLGLCVLLDDADQGVDVHESQTLRCCWMWLGVVVNHSCCKLFGVVGHCWMLLDFLDAVGRGLGVFVSICVVNGLVLLSVGDCWMMLLRHTFAGRMEVLAWFVVSM